MGTASNGSNEESFLVRLAKLEKRVSKLERSGGGLLLEAAHTPAVPPAIINAGPATPLTMEQAAAYSGNKAPSIKQLCRQGKLAHVVGPEGEFYTSKEAIDNYKTEVKARLKAHGELMGARWKAAHATKV